MAFGPHELFQVHNANMKSTVVSILLLAALLCASNSDSRATDADAADVAAVTSINIDVKSRTEVTLSSEDTLLYNLIMEYRKQNGLPQIPLSMPLTFVAQTHAKDLETPGLLTSPWQGVGCNGHSWSANGNWKSCCYTPDNAKVQCMWDKPRELTCVPDKPPKLACYGGNGIEISTGFYGLDGIMNARTALSDWTGSPPHNATLVNRGSFSRPWKAIGVGISQHFATVWFGHEADSEFSNLSIPSPSTEANSCTIHKTAAQCKSTSVCGWCLNVASCLPGTTAGSTVPAGSSATCSGSDWQFSDPSCASIYVVVSSCVLYS
jgi:hypothetical protein